MREHKNRVSDYLSRLCFGVDERESPESGAALVGVLFADSLSLIGLYLKRPSLGTDFDSSFGREYQSKECAKNDLI